ncbi:MAG: archease [Candidatus Aminicenantes bacterium]|nr:archease [Candidatus Aminicenantes bacterium]
MEKYRILDHAADGKFRAFGATLEEAFGNAALAVVSLMTDWEKVERRVVRAVAVEARGVEQLLVKFLTEVLYLSDVRGFILGGVEDVRIEGPGSAEEPAFRLSARFLGDDRPERYDFHGEVKAVTYSEMKIEACPRGSAAWMVQVVVDL